MTAVGFGGGAAAVTSAAASTSLISIIIALCTYYISGIALTLYNKWFIRDYNFNFPLTLILCHMIMNSLLSLITLRACGITTSYKNSRRLIPIGVLFGADIALTAVAFSRISVALCEVVKSGIPLFIMLADSIRNRYAISSTVVVLRAIVISILTVGIAMTSYGDITFEWFGFTAAMAATVCGVLKLLLIEYVLTETVHNNDIQTSTTITSDETSIVANGNNINNSSASNNDSNSNNNDDALMAASSSPTIVIADEHSVTRKHDQTKLIPTDHLSSDGIVDGNQVDHHDVDDRPDSINGDALSPSLSTNDHSYSLHPHRHRHTASDSSLYDGEGGEADELRRHVSPSRSVTRSLVSVTDDTSSRAIGPSASQTSLMDLARRDGRPSSALSTTSSQAPFISEHQQSQQEQHEDSTSISPSLTHRHQQTNGHDRDDVMNNSDDDSHNHHNTHHRRSQFTSADTLTSSSSSPPTSSTSSSPRLNPLVSLYYFSPVSAVLLIPMSVIMEWHNLRTATVVSTSNNLTLTISLILFGAILAFLLNVSELFVIQITSALTLCVLASAKFLVVVWASQAIFEANSEMSSINIYGNVISVVGVTLYNALKAYEMTVNQAAAATAAMVAETNQSLALAATKNKSDSSTLTIGVLPATTNTANNNNTRPSVSGNTNSGDVPSDGVGVSVEMVSYRKSRRKNKLRYAPLMMNDDVDMSEDSAAEDDDDDNEHDDEHEVETLATTKLVTSSSSKSTPVRLPQPPTSSPPLLPAPPPNTDSLR